MQSLYPKQQNSLLSGVKGTALVLLILILLTIIAYHNVRDNFFSCDDFAWLRNATISIQNPLHIFTTDIVGWFRPLGHAVFALNYWLFGLTSPLAYVIVSIIVHIITAFLVFVLATILLKNRNLALLAAMFFVLQHTHWEAVAWSAIVAETLAGLWFVLTIICFLKWREYSLKTWFLLAHIALIGGFLSAESVVTLPVMLLLADLFYYSKIWKQSLTRAFLPHISFLLLWGIYVTYELFLQWNGLHLGESGDYKVNLEFFLILIRSLLAYIFPRPLLLYMLEGQHITLLMFWIWLSLVVISILVFLSIQMKDTYYRHVLYASLWTIITMLPFCGFIRFKIIDSRQFYLSSVGVAILFSLALNSFYQRVRGKNSWKSKLKQGILVFSVLGIFGWNILEIWYEDARFEHYAREARQVLTFLQQSYAEFSSGARLYFTGLYTPHHFFADMMLLYYALKSSQVHYIGGEEMKTLAEHQREFDQPTYLFANHNGNLYDVTPDQYKYPLPADGKIDIGAKTAQKYLIQGFSDPETWVDNHTTFVWSRKPTSTIKVRFPSTDTDMTMILRVRPFRFSGLPQQSVDILVDDQLLDTLQLGDDFATYTVTIPKALISPRTNTIQFRYAYAISPLEASGGELKDGRPLAVAFDYVMFKDGL